MRKALPFLILFTLAAGAHASTLFRSDPAEYWTDYSDYAQGCRVVSHSDLNQGVDARLLTGWEVDGKVRSKGILIFADKKQDQTFVLDLDQQRPVGKIVLHTGLQDKKRIPPEVNIYGSNDGPEGPWTSLVQKGDMRSRNGYMLDNTPYRWLKFDFGVSEDGVGCRIKELEVRKRYYLPDLATLMQAFHSKINRDCPGLEDFWRKIDSKDWTGAASALRTFEEKRYEISANPPQYSANAKLALEDKIDFQNNVIIHFRQGIDWDFRPEGGLENTARGWVQAQLAREYSGTGDVRYAHKLVEYMNTYLEQFPRPPRTEPATFDLWATLSVGGRCGHWAQVLRLIVKDRQNFSDEFFLNVFYSLWEQYDYLYHGGKEGGNWLAVVSGNVLAGGMNYPEFADYKNWLDFGKSNFITNVMRDVYPDGKECENSDKYVPFAYGLLLGTYNALQESGVELPRQVHRRMSLGQDWSAWTLQPNMKSFMIGDSGGGSGPGLVRKTAEQFSRPDLLYIATQGKEGTVPSTASRDFPISGWYVMRSDWEDGAFDQARQLLLTAAPYGPHGHEDQLSISCYAYGNSLLSVPTRLGDVTYGAAEHWETIHTWSKNTVVVDGKPQPLGAGIQRLGERKEWFGGKYLDLAEASHPMYEDVIHRRKVLFLRGDYWIVIDDLTPKPDADPDKPHTYDQHFHFRDPSDAVPMKNGAVRSDFRRGGNLMLIPLEPGRLAASEKTSTPVNYPNTGPGTMYGWKYTMKGAGPQRFVTLLYPYTGEAPKVTVKRLDASEGVAALEVTTPSGRDVAYVGDSVQDCKYSKSLNARARVFVARLDKRGNPLRISGLDIEQLRTGSQLREWKDEAAKSFETSFQD